jgi:hypothetical protein
MKNPVSNVWWWLKYRLLNRLHVVQIRSLEPGYYDIDTRLFHAAFDLLVEYVEVELAWSGFLGAEIRLPWWQSQRAYVKAHAVELANKYFDWAIDDPEVGQEQGNSAKEIRALYEWYKLDRPRRQATKDMWVYNKDSHSKYTLLANLNDQYENEDTDNLIRLVRIRNHLWT